MASPILIVIVISILLYKIYKYVFGRPENFPPGPPRLPLFGSYFFLTLTNYRHMHRATETLSKFYNTKVLGFYYRNIPVIAVHDLKLCHDILNNIDLDNRPQLALVKARDPDFNIFGIFFKDGEFWRDQRRFSLRHLRDFGFGRRFQELEIHINEELLDMIDLFKNGPKYSHEHKYYKHGGFQFPISFSFLPGNLFLQVLMNERYERKNMEIIQRAAEAAMRFQKSADTYGRIFSVFEPFKYILPNGSGYKPLRQASMDLHKIIKSIILEQYNTFDPAHERNFLDIYFKEMDSQKNKSFLIEQLIHLVIDYIFPPLTGLAIQLSFTFQRLIMNEKILSKCQEEIDRVVGRGRLPGLDDRKNLSFTEACIRESMRLDTLTANGVPHMASRDTKIGQYDVPAGTVVITCLQVAHEDDKYFQDAKTFKPERFLNKNDELDLKLDTSVPFGAGKRLCAGETFARNILFLMTSTLLQNFNIRLPDGHKMHDPSLEEHPSGFAKFPIDFWIKFEPR